MGNISDAILMGSVAQEESKKKNPKISVADQVLGIPKIEREYTETETISAITGKPEVEWTPTGQPGPSMGAAIKTGFVDDPQTKINIYAKSRGIPPDRYRIIDNEIVFQADNGKWYSEEPTIGTGKLKAAAGNLIAHSPSIVMGAAGATVGPGAAALGAAGGEGIRKTVGAVVFDEPQTTMGNVKDMAVEGALGYATGGAGKGISKGAQYIGRRMGGITAKQAGRTVSLIDTEAAKQMMKAGDDLGITLSVPQATGSKRLADKFNLLGDSEATSDLIQGFRKKQKVEINDAINDFLDSISPVEGRLESGKRLQQAAKKSIERPVKIREERSAPIYKRAFKNNPDVDIKPVISWIENELKTAKGNVRTNLIKTKKILETSDLPKKKSIYDPHYIKIGEKRNYETSLKGLHDAKIAIDDEISKAAKARTGNVKRNYLIVKRKLLKQMDDASGDYARARKIFSDYSEEVERQAKKTLVSDVARTENDQIVTASRRLFKNIATSPETIVKARRQIYRQDPKAWNAALKSYIRDIFEKQKESAGGVDVVTNIGGMFFKRTMGDPQQKAIFKAAMTKQQFAYLEKLSSVLERAGMILRKESGTATRQQMQREITGVTIAKAVETGTRPMRTKSRVVGDWALSRMFDVNAKKLAEAMISTKGMRQLDRMYRMSDKSSKLIPSLTAFFGLIGGAELKRAHGTKNAK